MKKYKKAAEIAGLCVLLIAILVGGIWFLNRDGQPNFGNLRNPP